MVKSKKKRDYKFKPCPEPTKGTPCPVCGASWVCTQSWRKRLVNGRRREKTGKQGNENTLPLRTSDDPPYAWPTAMALVEIVFVKNLQRYRMHRLHWQTPMDLFTQGCYVL